MGEKKRCAVLFCHFQNKITNAEIFPPLSQRRGSTLIIFIKNNMFVFLLETAAGESGARCASSQTLLTQREKKGGDLPESWLFPLFFSRVKLCLFLGWMGAYNGSDGIRIVTTNGLGVFARLFDRAYYVTGHVPPLLARLGLNGSELIKWFERDQPT